MQMQAKIQSWLGLTTVLALGGCAPDLGESLGDGTTADGGPSAEEGGPQVQHEDEGSGVTRSTIDAASEADWVYLDLESGQQRQVTSPTSSDSWDLGLQRFEIVINGGISGSGGMEAVALEGVTLEDITQAPSQGWVTDAADGDDEDDVPDLALGGWYDYDFMTHVLTPRPQVYVVRTVEGHVFALEILDYYDEAGTSGFFTIRWVALEDE